MTLLTDIILQDDILHGFQSLSQRTKQPAGYLENNICRRPSTIAINKIESPLSGLPSPPSNPAGLRHLQSPAAISYSSPTITSSSQLQHQQQHHQLINQHRPIDSNSPANLQLLLQQQRQQKQQNQQHQQLIFKAPPPVEQQETIHVRDPFSNDNFVQSPQPSSTASACNNSINSNSNNYNCIANNNSYNNNNNNNNGRLPSNRTQTVSGKAFLKEKPQQQVDQSVSDCAKGKSVGVTMNSSGYASYSPPLGLSTGAGHGCHMTFSQDYLNNGLPNDSSGLLMNHPPQSSPQMPQLSYSPLSGGFGGGLAHQGGYSHSDYDLSCYQSQHLPVDAYGCSQYSPTVSANSPQLTNSTSSLPSLQQALSHPVNLDSSSSFHNIHTPTGDSSAFDFADIALTPLDGASMRHLDPSLQNPPSLYDQMDYMQHHQLLQQQQQQQQQQQLQQQQQQQQQQQIYHQQQQMQQQQQQGGHQMQNFNPSNMNGVMNGGYPNSYPPSYSCSNYPGSQQNVQQQQQHQQQQQQHGGQLIYGSNPGGGALYHSSPAGSSHTSSTSEESDDIYGYPGGAPGPYKRSPPGAPAAPAPSTAPVPVTPATGGRRARQGKKRKPRRDPNEPQKPVSAYALFFRDTQAAIKGQNPNASFGEVSKIVASMWDSLDTDAKNIYKQRTENAKKDYLKQLAAYRANQVSKGGNTTLEGFAEFSANQNRKTPFNPGNLTGGPLSTASPDSTTGALMHLSGGGGAPPSNNCGLEPPASEVCEKSLATLIAEPCPQQILTATTTLTVPQSYNMPNRNCKAADIHQANPDHPSSGMGMASPPLNHKQQQQQQQPQRSPSSMMTKIGDTPLLETGMGGHWTTDSTGMPINFDASNNGGLGIMEVVHGSMVPPHCRDVYTNWMQPAQPNGPAGAYAPV